MLEKPSTPETTRAESAQGQAGAHGVIFVKDQSASRRVKTCSGELRPFTDGSILVEELGMNRKIADENSKDNNGS